MIIYNQADITQLATFNLKVLNTARTCSGIALISSNCCPLHWYSDTKLENYGTVALKVVSLISKKKFLS